MSGSSSAGFPLRGALIKAQKEKSTCQKLFSQARQGLSDITHQIEAAGDLLKDLESKRCLIHSKRAGPAIRSGSQLALSRDHERGVQSQISTVKEQITQLQSSRKHAEDQVSKARRDLDMACARVDALTKEEATWNAQEKAAKMEARDEELADLNHHPRDPM